MVLRLPWVGLLGFAVRPGLAQRRKRHHGGRGARQDSIPHRTQPSHWVGLNPMSFSWGALAALSVGGGSSGGNGWPPGGVVTVVLAINSLRRADIR